MAKAHKINFGGVPEEIRSGGGRAAHVPPGDYLLKIVEAEYRENKKDTGHHFSWRFQIASGEYKGKTVYDITALKPDALWNLRNLIHAATGKNVAGKVLAFDPTKLYGKIIAATLEDDEYDNKVKSRPVDYRPKSELKAGKTEDDEDDEDEEETEEEVEEEEDDLEEVDVDEL